MTWTYQPTHHVIACGLCSSPDSEWEVLADRDRAGFAATSVLCRNCGLVFITPRMSAEGYAKFYGSGEYRRVVERLTGRPTDWNHLRHWQGRYAHCVGTWLVQNLPGPIEGGTLLDIGGSTGIVAASLKARFGLASATVLEPSEKECQEASSRGLCGECGSFETWDNHGRKFDIVTLWQTADHLLDVAGSLAKVRQMLAPGGWFVLDIVNVAFLIAGLQSVQKACKIDHPHSFTPTTMAYLLIRAGFEIVKHGSAMEGRKVFFLCRHGEPRDVAPEPASVEKFRRLVEEVRYANHGNGRNQRGSGANPDGGRPRTAAVD